MVECTGLENRRAGNSGPEGSNPSPSAEPMLEALKRMHPSDLRMIITVGLVRVPSDDAARWLHLIGSCLAALPPRPEVVDYYDGDRRMAAAVLLAEKSSARR